MELFEGALKSDKIYLRKSKTPGGDSQLLIPTGNEDKFAVISLSESHTGKFVGNIQGDPRLHQGFDVAEFVNQNVVLEKWLSTPTIVPELMRTQHKSLVENYDAANPISIPPPKSMDMLQEEVGRWANIEYSKSTHRSRVIHLLEEVLELGEVTDWGDLRSFSGEEYTKRKYKIQAEAADILLILFSILHNASISSYKAATEKFDECRNTRKTDTNIDPTGVEHHVGHEGSLKESLINALNEICDYEAVLANDPVEDAIEARIALYSPPYADRFLSREERLSLAPKTQLDYEVLLEEIATTRAQKVHQYGETRYEDPLSMSLLLTFVDIRRKYLRIIEALFNGKATIDGSESLRDAFLDLANYSVMGTQILDDHEESAVFEWELKKLSKLYDIIR